jgi:splicing factor, arginine/serine-rich 4/5/6
VSVEYAFRDDGEPGDRFDSPRRGAGGYGGQYDDPYRRSVSPDYRRPRPSPDYGRQRSPVYDRYGRDSAYDRPRSPDYGYRNSGYGRYRR